ncbi:MAG: phosphatase PAP2 family protein [Labilithrix sp.]|nr:phosphatase PAP2 family protein [Labilithrix sp.]MCW5817589.1 phosphatase PAP2 family protein [Labilithrix sp.]
MRWRAFGFAAATIAVLLCTRPARADDDDAPEPEPEAPTSEPAPPSPPEPEPAPPTPPGETAPIPESPQDTPTPPDAKTPLEHLARPPGQPVPVPTPSPVVLGGEPTQPGRAAVPLKWKRRRFSGVDYAILFTGAGLTLAAAIVQPIGENETGPIYFDRRVAKALRAPTLQTRYVFRDASDVGLSLAATWPFFIDALITAWWYRGSRDVAEQMSLLGLETLAVSGAIQGVTNVLVSRERPYGQTCGAGLPGDALDCTGSTHYRSFFSGHSAFSFTSASLICFNHLELELLGKPWDQISCGAAYAVAGATATFRVVANVHYPTDVLTGALLGTAIGWGVPLLHFRQPELATVKTTGGLTMRLVPHGAGAGVVGIF